MSYVTTDDGCRLYVEEQGRGEALLFIHEFAGDHRSWESQVRHFRDRYRCIVYDARGYPPSDVPSDPDAYSQQRAVQDALTVLDGLGVERAHVVGHSMGGFCALHLGLRAPQRARSVVIAGVGYGAAPEAETAFRRECAAIARAFREQGAAAIAPRYGSGPARIQLRERNPEAWEKFVRRLAEHSSEGAALTMLGVQSRRPSLYAMREELAVMRVPLLIMAGDEDDGCLEPSLMLKRTVRSAGLLVSPRTGHTNNLEEPVEFNRAVEEFLAAVEEGRWLKHSRPYEPGSITGISVQG